MNSISTKIEDAKVKLQYLKEKAEREFKEETTSAIHDFLERNKAYFPDGLHTYSRIYTHGTIHVWNEDGKKVKRTFFKDGRCTTKLQEESVEEVGRIAKMANELAQAIEKFEQVEGGRMFEYNGLHFKGTHTNKELGLEELPFEVHSKLLDGDFEWAISSDFRKAWNYNDFYKASQDDPHDVFYCMENGHYYQPSSGFLGQIHLDYLEQNIKYLMERYNERHNAA